LIAKVERFERVELIALMGVGSMLAEHDSGRSGDVVLTKSELAGMLGGLASDAMSFALAKYLLDPQATEWLVSATCDRAAELAERQSWDADQALLLRISRVAVFDVVRPEPGKLGVEPLSGRKVAQFVGFSDPTWRRRWVGRYREIISYLSGLDMAVQSCLAH